MGSLLRDFRYGVRMLIGKPGFTAAAVAVLALGIGANTAIFSLVNAFLLKPLLIEKPEQIVGVYSRDTRRPDYRAFSYPNYSDLRENNTVFTSLAAHNLAMAGLQEGDTTRRIFADLISSNFFETMGVHLFRGRTFTAQEERPSSAVPVAIVSYSFWKKKGADPDVLGKTVRVNGTMFTVVGIAPEGFTGTTALISPELYMPMGMYDAVINDFERRGRVFSARDDHTLILVGRLHPGLSQQAADAQLAVVAARMEKAYPAENKDQTFEARKLSRMSISTSPSSDTQLVFPAMLLLAIAGVVLLIASLNVANMMLARGTARRKEIAIRLALGGGRKNILQQLFMEGLLLALAGGAAGLFVAYWSTSLLIRSLSLLAPLDIIYTAGPDLRVLLATLAFCVFSTILFGMGPAWALCRPHILSGLKDGEHVDVAQGKRRRLFSRRNVLVMSQISLSLMLLTAAGLFIRSSMRAAQVEPGFRLDHGILAEVDASLAGYDEAHGRQIYRALLDKLATVPGVTSTGLAATVPFGMVSLGRDIQRPSDPAVHADCSFNIVSENYFNTLGIPVMRGRTFRPTEGGKVVILDKLAAARIWPNEDAVGKQIRMMTNDGTKTGVLAEVVGVVGSTQQNIFGSDWAPHVYVPFGQEYMADMHIHLRTAVAGGDAESRLLESVRREIRAADDRLPVLALKTLRDHLDSSFDIWAVRTGARMFGIFGAVAVLLAMIGLYGVRAYAVVLRTREIGIRMALGAAASDTLRMVFREGMTLMAIGTALGFVLSLALGRLLSSMLYRVSGADPLVLSAAPALLTMVSLFACYFPARKASRVDPMVALRHE